MARCRFYDYVEKNGNTPIREWLNKLSPDDRARIDSRLLSMEALPLALWSEKWVSKYKTTELFELRIKGKSVQYRPLGLYYGQGKFVILAGAVETGDKIKKSYIETAEARLKNLKGDASHARLHQFDDDKDLEEAGE